MVSKKIIALIILCFLVGFLGALSGVYAYLKFSLKPTNSTAEYYQTETENKVSPATLRKKIDDKDPNYILVDLRSEGEYKTEHMITAINIPAVTMNEEQLVAEFSKLPKDKEIIVHCYSAYCMLGREVGNVLAKRGIYVKDLNIGWSEWKYYWGIWNPGEDPKVGIKYIEKGVGGSAAPGVCTKGQFGC